MTVYLVMYYYYDCTDYVAIYSNREAAEKYIEAQKSKSRYDIEEVVVEDG